ncbi:citrate lyase subunit beta / citryl-CoA lyase [Proteiniborus ethanoligenes]|uniref:Citrate lyase subunit beta / citryl-CoA lyase n=1 Tax=Proteiniborus ethanoligenes TaxID=415015 RepID=A0A1H3L0L2_9FIRM|nr:aldolase/citrate lyase family protein [Proteiniborus ethanoligenes]SDY57769.1 citrate lyase subunit beta / citryl-CoA lyase [Proteiniborus ethanoligenes]
MKRLRRTMMFVPASNPNMMVNAPVFKPDCIIFDLEDAISLREKDSARDLVAEALKSIDYSDCEVFVRTNPLYTPFGEEDVRVLVAAGLRNVRLPMTETAEDIINLDELLTEIEKELGLENGIVKILGAIETAKGVINAEKIATASTRMLGISFGAEDFTRTIGAERSKSGEELFVARSKIVLAAAAAGIDAIDTVFSDINDDEGFRKETEMAKKLGFAGKSIIHPRQIKIVHQVFTPSKIDVDNALRVIQAIEEAEQKGLGVISLDGKMVDAPVVARAERIVRLAKGAGII